MHFLFRFLAIAIVLAALGVTAEPSDVQAQPAGVSSHGLGVVTVTPEVMAEHGLLVPFGAMITAVEPGSAAATLGLAQRDVIISVGSARVLTAEELSQALGRLRDGDQAELAIISPGRAPRKVALAIAAGTNADMASPAGVQPQGEPVLMLDTGGHMALVKGIAFTHDGRHIVSASEDKVVRVWDWETGRTVRMFRGQVGPGPEGKFYAMALSPAEPGVSEGHRWLAVGGYLGTHTGRGPRDREEAHKIRLYDFASGRIVRLLSGHTNIVNGLAFSRDGRFLISGGADHAAVVWDVQTGRMLHRLRGHTNDIYAVTFSADGRRAITGSYDRTIKIWDMASGKAITTMAGHKGGLTSIAINPQDGTIVSGSLDGEIRVWDGDTGAPVKVLLNQKTSVGILAITPDGQRLLSTCGQRHPCEDRVYALPEGEHIATHKIDDNIVLAGSIHPNGRLTATAGGYNHVIHVWDLASGHRVRDRGGKPLKLAGTGRIVWSAGFSADGSSLVWGKNWTRRQAGEGYGPFEFRLRLPRGAERLGQPQQIAPDEAGRPDLWHRGTNRRGAVQLSHRAGGPFNYLEAILDVSVDGKNVASIPRSSSDGLAHYSYAMALDGRSVISGGGHGQIMTYGLDGKRTGDFIGHEGTVWGVSQSPDGGLLVSASSDQTVRLWNYRTRQLIVTLFHGDDGEWVMWTPQGYYTGSQRAGDLVGWQQNYGPDKEARYVQAGRLRHLLRRPDIVERAIVLRDAGVAVAELATGGPKLADLVRRPPPELWLRGDETTATGRARLVLEVERTGRPVKAYDVYLGGTDPDTGLFVPERRLVHRPIAVPAAYSPQFPERELIAFEVGMREGTNLIAVVARTDVGETTTVPTQVISRADALGTQEGALRVLSIGIDRYPGAVAYPGHLTFAGKDARDFADTARRTMGGRHTNVVAEVLYNGAGGNLEPTKANIEAALQRLSRSGPKDTVVLFIAGHGESRRGQYVVLPTDHRRERPDDAGEVSVEWRTIREALASAPGRRLVFLDTCYAGNAYNDALSGDARSFAFAVFTAAQSGAIAMEDPKLGQGRFTHALRLGLQGEAMRNNSIEVYDLGPYVSRKVRELSNGAQEAEFFSGAGNFVLVRK